MTTKIAGSLMLIALSAGLVLQGHQSSKKDGPARPSERGSRAAAQSISLADIAETLDAIHSELVLSGLCKGGESIQVAMRASPDEQKTIEIVYHVPGVLQVYRLGYIQSDGVIILADDLSFRDWETRYSMKPVDSNRFSKLYDEFPIRIEAIVAANATPRERARHTDRVAHKREAAQQP